jgi:ParB family chromosome partitioning protein
MSLERTDRKIVDVPVARLRPHPRQAEIYAERPDWQIEELAQSMARDGQEEPVEILRNNTIIVGHGRVAAAKRLGWAKIRCIVRSDLEAAGPEAVEARLIESNLTRRQLTKLDMVRSYQRLKELARSQNGRLASTPGARGDVRDQLAKRFGVCGRTLDRWQQVTELPLALQQAVDQSRLPLTAAVKLVGLSQEVLLQIARRLSQGESARKVVTEHLKKSGKARSAFASALAQLVRSLRRARQDLADEVEDEAPRDALDVLRQGKLLLEKLIAQVERDREEGQKRLAKILADLDPLREQVRK